MYVGTRKTKIRQRRRRRRHYDTKFQFKKCCNSIYKYFRNIYSKLILWQVSRVYRKNKRIFQKKIHVKII